MSRIGKQPVPVPAGVKVRAGRRKHPCRGAQGPSWNGPGIRPSRSRWLTAARPSRSNGPTTSASAAPSTAPTRNIIKNMIVGVTNGYEKRLKIEGIGYQAVKAGKGISLKVGYANDIKLSPPDGVTVDLPDPTTIVVKGADKQKVGQFAAVVRAARKPEPYKGKGIRYENETVRRKEGKSFASGG